MKANFYSMNIDMIEEISQLDARCFNRAAPRTEQNLATFYAAYPEGCFVVTDNQRIFAYIFAHRLGAAGYIGPLGVDPEYRERGAGRAIIAKEIEALISSGCNAIGLEMLPESGYNLGLHTRWETVI